MLHRDAIAALAREGARSRRALTLERATLVATPPLLALAAWMTVAMAGGQEVLPPLTGTLLAIVVLAGLAWFVLRAARRWKPPTPTEVRTRLTQDAGLALGALESLGDSPVTLDAGALALWRREQERTVEIASRAKAGPARPDFGRADPWRLRYILPVALLAAAIFAGAAGPDRLARAFIPDPGPLVGDHPMAIEAWVTPGAYTGGAPVSLSDRIGDRIETPPQPEATIRVTGPAAAPWLVYDGRVDGRHVHHKMRFVRGADGAYETKFALPGAGTLRVVRFHTKARWRIAPTPDAAPKGKFTSAPVVGENDRIAFEWSASDDYGVRGLALRLTPLNPPPGLIGAEPVDMPIEAPAGDPKTATGKASVDLSMHPYAGMKVDAQLVIVDAIGQKGASEAAPLRVPEKIFLQPLARAAVEIRKLILRERRAYAKHAPYRSPRIAGVDDLFGIRTDDEDPRITRAPSAIRRAGRMIDALTLHPQDGYFRDPAVFAGFRLARATLDTAREIAETDYAADILWQVALRAEYGDAADAKRALMAAQQALSDAIQRGADADEIARLSQALQQATDNYLQALVQEAVRKGERAETSEDAEQQSQMSQRDIQEMLDEIQRRAEAGDQAGAQALLQQLSQLLNNLEIKLADGGEGQGEDGKPTELEQAVDGLSEQIGKQRSLRDDTAREEQEPQPGNQTEQQLGERQEQLREDLRAAEQKARGAGGTEGEKDLSQAGDAMDRAAQALKRGDAGEAGRQQDEALRRLRSGAEKLSNEAMAQRDGRDGREEGESGEEDPLGRQMSGTAEAGDETAVPSQTERQRAREILDELRRRAQDTTRPEAEREYLKRLLDRFTGS
ncbi:MAG: DUF4175 family protein [Hyphomonadaceae bacterium]|nr:DUF4175 family protein [Hyphomonadaceae bacterium]